MCPWIFSWLGLRWAEIDNKLLPVNNKVLQREQIEWLRGKIKSMFFILTARIRKKQRYTCADQSSGYCKNTWTHSTPSQHWILTNHVAQKHEYFMNIWWVHCTVNCAVVKETSKFLSGMLKLRFKPKLLWSYKYLMVFLCCFLQL